MTTASSVLSSSSRRKSFSPRGSLPPDFAATSFWTGARLRSSTSHTAATSTLESAANSAARRDPRPGPPFAFREQPITARWTTELGDCERRIAGNATAAAPAVVVVRRKERRGRDGGIQPQSTACRRFWEERKWRAALPANRLVQPVDDPRLVDVVRRHLQLHPVSIRQADEALAHFARDMGENGMLVLQRDAEHGSGKHFGDLTFGFDDLFGH